MCLERDRISPDMLHYTGPLTSSSFTIAHVCMAVQELTCRYKINMYVCTMSVWWDLPLCVCRVYMCT